MFAPSSEIVRKTYNLSLETGPIPKEEENDAVLVKVNYKDMPRLITEGFASECVIGYDQLLDYLGRESILKKLVKMDEFNEYAAKNNINLKIENLNSSKCRVVIAVPSEMGCVTEKEVFGNRILTEYTGIAKLVMAKYADIISKYNREPEIVKISGCSEVYPNVIMDITSTGDSLRRNEKEIYSEIVDSAAVIVRNSKN